MDIDQPVVGEVRGCVARRASRGRVRSAGMDILHDAVVAERKRLRGGPVGHSIRADVDIAGVRHIGGSGDAVGVLHDPRAAFGTERSLRERVTGGAGVGNGLDGEVWRPRRYSGSRSRSCTSCGLLDAVPMPARAG